MKKILLTMILLAIVAGVKAQDCNFWVNEIDEFTKAEKIETKPFRTVKGLTHTATIAFRKVNEDYYVWFGLTAGGTVNEGDKLLFKTEDGKIIEATSTETRLPYYERDGPSVWAYYSISKENLKLLASSTIELIRMNFTKTYSDFEVPERGKILIKKNANCILNAKIN